MTASVTASEDAAVLAYGSYFVLGDVSGENPNARTLKNEFQREHNRAQARWRDGKKGERSMFSVQYIACTNDSTDVIWYQVQETLDGTHWATLDWRSRELPRGHSVLSPDPTTIGIAPAALYWRPLVYVGESPVCQGPPVGFAHNDETAIYSVRGKGTDLKVSLFPQPGTAAG